MATASWTRSPFPAGNLTIKSCASWKKHGLIKKPLKSGIRKATCFWLTWISTIQLKFRAVLETQELFPRKGRHRKTVAIIIASLYNLKGPKRLVKLLSTEYDSDGLNGIPRGGSSRICFWYQDYNTLGISHMFYQFQQFTTLAIHSFKTTIIWAHVHSHSEGKACFLFLFNHLGGIVARLSYFTHQNQVETNKSVNY